MTSSRGGPANVAETLWAPIKFSTTPATYWAMIDTGAQVSLISTGLIAHLGLLDSEGARTMPSGFRVSGFDGQAREPMPIIEVWMRFGARGGNIRWDKVHLACVSSPACKIILGIDVLKPR